MTHKSTPTQRYKSEQLQCGSSLSLVITNNRSATLKVTFQDLYFLDYTLLCFLLSSHVRHICNDDHNNVTLSFLPPNRRPVSTCFACFVITDCVVAVSQFVAVSCYWGSEFSLHNFKVTVAFCINTSFKECVSASLCGGSSPKQRRRKKLIVTWEHRSECSETSQIFIE